MSNHLRENRIQDYVDDLLCREERAEVEQHLSQCAVCQHEVATYRDLVADVRSVPPEVQPQRDLLTGINARIDAESVAQPRVSVRDARLPLYATPDRYADHAVRLTDRSVRSLRVPLAAAAMLLIAISAAVTAVIVDRTTSPQVMPVAQQPENRAVRTVSTGVEEKYRGAAEELERELNQMRPELPPETVHIVEENLRVINKALAEARAALREEPNDPALSDLMRSAYEKKLDLLRHAVRRGET